MGNIYYYFGGLIALASVGFTLYRLLQRRRSYEEIKVSGTISIDRT
jgi:hypothetical protein